MGPSGSCLPACLTSSHGWALHQEQILRDLGVRDSYPEIPSPYLNSGRENGVSGSQSSQCAIWSRNKHPAT
eukprot:scaffold242624_cov17-Tisochrysis_lutea.AAC.1